MPGSRFGAKDPTWNEYRRNSGKPLAVSGQKYARRGTGRDVRGVLGSLRRPSLCFQEFGQSKRISLPHRTGTASDAPISSAISSTGQGGEADQFDRSGEHERESCLG